MSDHGPILVGVDASDGALVAIGRARALAEETGAGLILCAVLDRDPPQELIDAVHTRLTDLADSASVQVRIGVPFVELIRAGREADARLLVAGATGEHTQGQLALGVTVDRLARKADRPVLVARNPRAEPYRRVVVGIDGSEDGRRAAETARALAVDAHILAVHVSQVVGEQWLNIRRFSEHDLERYRALLREEAESRLSVLAAGLTVDALEGATGRPESALLTIAARDDADLIAVGRKGVSPVASVLLGSVGHHLVHEAPCDVLVYRSPVSGFDLP